MCVGDAVNGIGSLMTGGLAAVGLGSLFGSNDSSTSATAYVPPSAPAPASAPVSAVATELKQDEDLVSEEEKKKKKLGRNSLRNDMTNTTGASTDAASASGINILG